MANQHTLLSTGTTVVDMTRYQTHFASQQIGISSGFCLVMFPHTVLIILALLSSECSQDHYFGATDNRRNRDWLPKGVLLVTDCLSYWFPKVKKRGSSDELSDACCKLMGILRDHSSPQRLVSNSQLMPHCRGMRRVKTWHSLKNAVFWDVATCGSCKNRRFMGT
jgi:hypothetical protein